MRLYLKKGGHSMQDFIYSYPTKVYFGKDALTKASGEQLSKHRDTGMLAYGGGSIKRMKLCLF